MDLLNWIKGVTDEGDDAYDELTESPVKDSGEDIGDTIANISSNINLNNEKGGSMSYTASNNLSQYKLFKPTSYDNDVFMIADQLKENRTVVLNLEATPSDVGRRIFDFLSGVSYAKGGCVEQLAARTFLITPYPIEFSAETILEQSDIY